MEHVHLYRFLSLFTNSLHLIITLPRPLLPKFTVKHHTNIVKFLLPKKQHILQPHPIIPHVFIAPVYVHRTFYMTTFELMFFAAVYEEHVFVGGDVVGCDEGNFVDCDENGKFCSKLVNLFCQKCQEMLLLL